VKRMGGDDSCVGVEVSRSVDEESIATVMEEVRTVLLLFLDEAESAAAPHLGGLLKNRRRNIIILRVGL
jgi:hypothetical protein